MELHGRTTHTGEGGFGLRVENECGIMLTVRGTKGVEVAPFVAFFRHGRVLFRI